jgi:hypothetical protein
MGGSAAEKEGRLKKNERQFENVYRSRGGRADRANNADNPTICGRRENKSRSHGEPMENIRGCIPGVYEKRKLWNAATDGER